jgi:uncharacterized protein YecT (DUF1311 family)
MGKLLLVVALVTVAASPAPANQIRCSGLTQLEMNGCAADELVAREAQLERILRSIRAPLSGEERQVFERAQGAWVEYRAAECERRTFLSRGGSVHGMDRAFCMAGLAHERTIELSRQLR